MLSRDRLMSITGLAFVLGLALGAGASVEVHPADVVSDNLTVTQTTFVTERSVPSNADIMDTAMSRATLFEGFEPRVYTFRGVCHIGYGHNTSCSNRDVMTPASALQLLQAEMSLIQGELMQALPFYNNLHYKARAVLLDMGFNMGLTNLLKFERMLGHMESGNWWWAMMEIENSLYWDQVNSRADANIHLLFEILEDEETMYEPIYTVF